MDRHLIAMIMAATAAIAAMIAIVNAVIAMRLARRASIRASADIAFWDREIARLSSSIAVRRFAEALSAACSQARAGFSPDTGQLPESNSPRSASGVKP